MCPNSIYVGLNVVPLYRYFKANVYTIWVHGPLGNTLDSLSSAFPSRREPGFLQLQRESSGQRMEFRPRVWGLGVLGLRFRSLGLRFRA